MESEIIKTKTEPNESYTKGHLYSCYEDPTLVLLCTQDTPFGDVMPGVIVTLGKLGSTRILGEYRSDWIDGFRPFKGTIVMTEE